MKYRVFLEHINDHRCTITTGYIDAASFREATMWAAANVNVRKNKRKWLVKVEEAKGFWYWIDWLIGVAR